MIEATIRRALPHDISAIVGLLSEAGEWLGQRGLDQWQYPPRRERIRAGVDAGHVYVVEALGRAMATLTLDDHADPEFWTASDDPDDALYVHRLAVARAASGHELGSALLDWAGRQAQAAGRRWLRLDAWRTNPDLHRYYLDRGFHHIRTVELAHRGSGALFQRPAELARYTGCLRLRDVAGPQG